jgi:hypothetical protein
MPATLSYPGVYIEEISSGYGRNEGQEIVKSTQQ